MIRGGQIQQSDGETSKTKRLQKPEMSPTIALSSARNSGKAALVFLKSLLWGRAFGFPQSRNPQQNCGELSWEPETWFSLSPLPLIQRGPKTTWVHPTSLDLLHHLQMRLPSSVLLTPPPCYDMRGPVKVLLLGRLYLPGNGFLWKGVGVETRRC